MVSGRLRAITLLPGTLVLVVLPFDWDVPLMPSSAQAEQKELLLTSVERLRPRASLKRIDHADGQLIFGDERARRTSRSLR